MSPSLQHRYWRSTVRLTAGMLGVWLLVSVLVPWFARDLDRFQIFGFPLGWWLAAEGALLVYLALIVVHIVAMERLESGGPASRPGDAPAIDVPEPASEAPGPV